MGVSDLEGLSDRLARGDAAALRVAYESYRGVALAVSFRILKSRVEAEEIVQETFIEVWRRATQHAPERGNLLTWIAMIARSRAIDRLRSNAARSRMHERLSAEPLAIVSVTQNQDEPETNSEGVRGAIERLPTDQRFVIELAFRRGWTQQEIAERTDLPLGTVKSRLRSAMQKLSRELKASA
ncbi:MAG: sigma-70 family RNA polymerase sigma factor [Polyangiaceae bacterium]|nr:sigma-70 family RNA polymerase sigma factor [Polyangiaceae bacterium]